jgi:hypothetical protein
MHWKIFDHDIIISKIRKDRIPPVRTPTPIRDFAMGRLKDKTGGINAQIAREHRYAHEYYFHTIDSFTKKVPKEGTPNLSSLELRTSLSYNSYTGKFELVRRTYIDGNPEGRSDWYYLDEPPICTFLLGNWDAFVTAIDEIAKKIVEDCPKEYLKLDGNCPQKIINKIKETEGT